MSQNLICWYQEAFDKSHQVSLKGVQMDDEVTFDPDWQLIIKFFGTRSETKEPRGVAMPMK